MADKVDTNEGGKSGGVEKAADKDPKQTLTGTKPRDGPIRRAQTKMGLEPALLIAMTKGALPPIISMAAYQSTAWAKVYTTLGYLVCIVSFLSMAMTSRAKFLNSLIRNLLCVCLGAAIVLLQIQITVSARQTTTHGPEKAVLGSSGSLEAIEYNAAANTVSGLGLFITVYMANT